MKQKRDDSEEVVTKGFFREELETIIDRLLKGIRAEINFAIETVNENTDLKTAKSQDLTLTRFDGIMKELETIREDNTIGTYQIKKLRGNVEDHEKRIVKIERLQKAA